MERGWALVGGFVIIYTLISLSTYLFFFEPSSLCRPPSVGLISAFSSLRYWEKVFNMTVAYRSALVGTIYMKTLRLSSVAAREVGQVRALLTPCFSLARFPS